MPRQNPDASSLPQRLGKYRIEGYLGSGGTGVVYRARNVDNDRPVALKTLHRLNASSLMRLKREFRSVADVAHPNVAVLHELVCADGDWFLSMDLVDGVDFVQYVRGAKEGVLSPGTEATRQEAVSTLLATPPIVTPTLPTVTGGVFESGNAWTMSPDIEVPARPATGLPPGGIERLEHVLYQLCDAVAALHLAGKLHLDLKPANVLVTPKGHVVVLDFGLLHDRHDTEELSEVSGTPAYAAPEQFFERVPTEACDWYAVGVMLFQALTGRLPFAGSVSEILQTKRDIDPPRPSELADGVPTDLDDLCVHLMRRNPAERPTSVAVQKLLQTWEVRGAVPTMLGAWFGPSSELFVGRAEELQMLRNAHAFVRQNGTAKTICVLGRSGIGKSALVRTFLDELRSRPNTLVLGGRCYAQEQVPYRGFDTIVDALCRHLLALAPDQRESVFGPAEYELARIFPVLRRCLPEGFSLPEEEGLDPNELQRRAFAGLRGCLHAVAIRQETVLFIDDLQWGDGDSARLLVDLLSPPNPPPMLCIFSFRSEEVATSSCYLRLVNAPSETGITQLQLDGLRPDDAFQLATALLGGASGESSCREILEESDGSPFFIEQLARHPAARDGTAHGTAVLPRLLDELLAQWPPEASALMERIALSGLPTPQGAIIGTTLRPDDARSALQRLRAGRLVRLQGSSDHDAVEAYHDRIREAVVRRLSPEVRRARHRELAEALDAFGGIDASRLATHYAEAGVFERATAHAERAAEAARRALAFERAAEMYALAIRCEPIAARRAARKLEQRQADALVDAGQCAQAAAVYLRAAEHAPMEDVHWMKTRAAEQLLVSGHIEAGTAVLDPVLKRAGIRHPSSRDALAAMLFNIVRFEVSQLRPRPVRQESAYDQEALRRIDLAWAACKGYLSFDSNMGAYFLSRSLLDAARLGQPFRLARSLAVYGMAMSFEGRPSGVKRGLVQIQRAEAIAEQLDDAYLRGIIDICRGTAIMSVCDFSGGLSLLQSGIQRLRAERAGASWEIAAATSSCFTVYSWTGDYEECVRLGTEWRKHSERVGDRFGVVTGEIYGALGALGRGDLGEARSLVESARSRWQAPTYTYQDWMATKVLALAYLFEQKPNSAVELLDAAWPRLLRSKLLRVQLMNIDAHLIVGIAELSKLIRRPGGAPDQVEAHAKALEGIPRPLATAGAALLRGQVAMWRGDSTSAVRLLRGAEEGLASVGAMAHRNAARLLLAELKSLSAIPDAALEPTDFTRTLAPALSLSQR